MLAVRAVLLFGFLMAGVELGRAQEGQAPAAPPPADPSAPAAPLLPPAPTPEGAASDPLPDPTQPSPGLRELLGPIGPGATAAAPAPLPEILLRGRVIRENQSGSALLEIAGRLYIVRAGAEFTHGSLTLKVRDISATEVVLELEPLRRTLSLR